MTTIAEVMELMPVGFRFYPTDEELVIHYLKPKLRGTDPQPCIIPEVDIYRWEPWDLPDVFDGKSDINSYDPDWWFLCPRDPNSTRASRTTESGSGFWKKTGIDQDIKARGTTTVIATKKIYVFHTGHSRNGVKTHWVMHEYNPPDQTLPNQRTFVMCHVMNKADDLPNASTRVEAEPSSSNFNPAPETGLGALFQPRDHNFPPSLQLPMNNQQQPFLEDFLFADARSNNGIRVQSGFDRTEPEVDPMDFVNSLLVENEQDVYYDEIMQPGIFNDSSTPESLTRGYYGDGGISSDTDTDTTQARFQPALGTSNLFNEHVSTRAYRQMRMVKTESGTLPSSNCGLVVEQADPSADTHINSITVVSPESPVKRKPFRPQYQRRSHNFVAERAAPRSNELQIISLLKAASKDKAKDAAKHNTDVDLQQKEKSITKSDKEREMTEGTNAKKGLKLTTDDSASSNRKGCFTFLESSPLRHDESRPPSEYFVKVVLGVVFFAVFIRELLLFGNWC